MFWRYNGLDAACTREIRDVQVQAIWKPLGISYVFNARNLTPGDALIDLHFRGSGWPFTTKEMKDGLDKEIADLQIIPGRRYRKACSCNLFSTNGTDGDVVMRKARLCRRKSDSRLSVTETAEIRTLNKVPWLSFPKDTQILFYAASWLFARGEKLLRLLLSTTLGVDGRLRCLLDHSGTRTGRLSSRAALNFLGKTYRISRLRFDSISSRTREKFTFIKNMDKLKHESSGKSPDARTLNEIFDDPKRHIHRENGSRMFRRRARGHQSHAIPPRQERCPRSHYGQGPEQAADVHERRSPSAWGRPGEWHCCYCC